MNKENLPEVAPTQAGIMNGIIKLIKQEYPNGQYFIKKNCEDKTFFMIEDHTPAGIVLMTFKDRVTGKRQYHTVSYFDFFKSLDNLQKVTIGAIEIDDEKIPEVYANKMMEAQAVITKMKTVFAETLCLDPDKVQEKEMVYRKVRNWMNVEYLPVHFKSVTCELFRQTTTNALLDMQGPEVVVDKKETLEIGIIRKEFLEKKISEAEAAAKPKKALINKHDVQKIMDAKGKKAKNELFKVGAKYIFVKTLDQFCVLETLKITKIDRKEKMITLESTSDTQSQPVVRWSFDHLLSLLKDYVLIYKNNLLTKKLRYAKESSKQLDILLSVVKKAKSEK